MSVMGEAMYVLGQGVYGKTLYFLLHFAMNLNRSKNKLYFFSKKKKSYLVYDSIYITLLKWENI